MCMYVCMYLCMYICMHVCLCTSTYACIQKTFAIFKYCMKYVSMVVCHLTFVARFLMTQYDSHITPSHIPPPHIPTQPHKHKTLIQRRRRAALKRSFLFWVSWIFYLGLLPINLKHWNVVVAIDFVARGVPYGIPFIVAVNFALRLVKVERKFAHVEMRYHIVARLPYLARQRTGDEG